MNAPSDFVNKKKMNHCYEAKCSYILKNPAFSKKETEEVNEFREKKEFNIKKKLKLLFLI